MGQNRLLCQQFSAFVDHMLIGQGLEDDILM